MSYAKDVLVETSWLAEHLDDDSIRIVEVDENPARYAEAHIPGAIGFDWRLDLQDPAKRDFLSAEAFGLLMGGRGISNKHTIVLYGDRNNWFAAYAYWYFRYYGHAELRLLNGPREKWIAEGRETSTEVPSYPAASFTARPGRRFDPRLSRRGVRGARRRRQSDRRAQPSGVFGPGSLDGRLRARGRSARRPHPGRRLGALGTGGKRGWDLQVSRGAASALRLRRASPATRG